MSSRASSSTPVRLSARAYLKLLLHAAKYPHRAVCGVLLARDDAHTSGSDPLAVDDVVPLFHTLPLPAAMEVALDQVERWAASSQPAMHLAGVYYSSERYDAPRDTLPMPHANGAAKMAERIRDNCKGDGVARVLLVGNKLQPNSSNSERVAPSVSQPLCSFPLLFACASWTTSVWARWAARTRSRATARWSASRAAAAKAAAAAGRLAAL